MQHVGEQLADDFLDLAAVRRAGEVVANDLLALVHNALDDDRLGAHLEQGAGVLLHKFERDILALIGDAGENRGFGEVGREHVGAAH